MSLSNNDPIPNAHEGSVALRLERGIGANAIHSPNVVAGLFGRRARCTDRATDIYVDSVTGNDADTGLSATAAVETLAKAAELLPEIVMHMTIVHISGPHMLVDHVAFTCVCLDGGVLVIMSDHANVTEVLAEVTPDSSTTSTLTDSGASWTIDAYRGMLLEPTDSSLAGNRYTILGNTADTITLGSLESTFDTANGGLGPKFRIVIPSTVISSTTSKSLRIFISNELCATSSSIQNLFFTGTAAVYAHGGILSFVGVCYDSTGTTNWIFKHCHILLLGGSMRDDSGGLNVAGFAGWAGLGFTGTVSGDAGRIYPILCKQVSMLWSVIPLIQTPEEMTVAPAWTLRIRGSRILAAQTLKYITAAIGDVSIYVNTRVASLTLEQVTGYFETLVVDGATVHGVLLDYGSNMRADGVISGANAAATGLGIQLQGRSQLQINATPSVSCQAGAQGAGFDGSTQADTYANLSAAGTNTVNDGVGGDYSLIGGRV